MGALDTRDLALAHWLKTDIDVVWSDAYQISYFKPRWEPFRRSVLWNTHHDWTCSPCCPAEKDSALPCARLAVNYLLGLLSNKRIVVSDSRAIAEAMDKGRRRCGDGTSHCH